MGKRTPTKQKSRWPEHTSPLHLKVDVQTIWRAVQGAKIAKKNHSAKQNGRRNKTSVRHKQASNADKEKRLWKVNTEKTPRGEKTEDR